LSKQSADTADQIVGDSHDSDSRRLREDDGSLILHHIAHQFTKRHTSFQKEAEELPVSVPLRGSRCSHVLEIDFILGRWTLSSGMSDKEKEFVPFVDQRGRTGSLGGTQWAPVGGTLGRSWRF
jgi:hypothetical protein